MSWNSKWMTVLFIAGSVIVSANGWSETSKIAPGPANPDSVPLAVVGGKAITAEDFRNEMARRRVEQVQKRKEDLLDSMVRSELLFAAAKSAGYENDPEVITAVKQVMAGKYLRDNLEPRLLNLKATDQEAEAYYQAHLSQFSVPAMVHAALIKVAVSPKATAEKKSELLRRAEGARAEALALEHGLPAFGSVAVKYSEDPESRYRGGDIGWLKVGAYDVRWDKKVMASLFLLERPSQVSTVVEAADGYYIVKLMETKGATVKPYAEVKDGVRYAVVQGKRKKVEEEFVERLKGSIPVTVNREVLGTITPTDEEKKRPPALPAR